MLRNVRNQNLLSTSGQAGVPRESLLLNSTAELWTKYGIAVRRFPGICPASLADRHKDLPLPATDRKLAGEKGNPKVPPSPPCNPRYEKRRFRAAGNASPSNAESDVGG
jgi:hypothetical protein